MSDLLTSQFNREDRESSSSWMRMLLALYLIDLKKGPNDDDAIAPPIALDPEPLPLREVVSSRLVFTEPLTEISAGVFTPPSVTGPRLKFEIPGQPPTASSRTALFSSTAAQMLTPNSPSPRLPDLHGKRLTFIGDSIGNGFGLFAKGLGVDVVNLGIDKARLGMDNPGLKTSNVIADVSKVPANSDVIFSVGTNDIISLIGDGGKHIDDYAKEVVARAIKMRDNGCDVHLLSINPPKDGEYLGGGDWWKIKKNQEDWKVAAKDLNDAFKAEIERVNAASPGKRAIEWEDISALKNLRAADNLHYSAKAYAAMTSGMGLDPNKPVS